MTHIEIDYEPRALQQDLHDLMGAHRFGVTVAHRRFGKTWCMLQELNKRAVITDKTNYRAGYIAPTYAQAKSIAWTIIKDIVAVVPGIIVNESELRVDYPNGSRIRLHGGDKPESLRGLYFDDVVFDEFDDMKPELWTQIIRPAISDRKGNAYFIGTFAYTDGPLGQIYDYANTQRDWYNRVYKASETHHVDPLELADAAKIMDPEEYAREFECARSAAVKGSIYGKYMDELDAKGLITTVPYNPSLGVTTAWDLGMGDSMAIWFAQVAGREVQLIDYHEDSGEGLDEYARVLDAKGYKYREHIAPHDIKVREIGATGGRSRYESAQALGINFRILPRVSQTLRSEVDEHIAVARMLLPRCVFDAVNCKAGVDALRSYRRVLNQKTNEYGSTPLHDWSSHGANAFEYLAMGIQVHAKVDRPKPNTRWVT